MPFCSNCGRQLGENESCNCQKSQAPSPNQVPPPQPNNNVQPGFQQYDQYGRPLFTPQGQPIYYDAQGKAIIGGQKKKKNSGCIIALCVSLLIFLIIGLILAAIFVPAMLGYVKKSKTAAANTNAKTITTNIKSALVDMTEKGMTIDGRYIVCSDSSKNLYVDGEKLDFDTLYYTAREYGSIDSYEWFVVIEHGAVTYAAANCSDNDDYVGTFPNISDARRGSPSYTGVYDDDADLDELYDAASSSLYDQITVYAQ